MTIRAVVALLAAILFVVACSEPGPPEGELDAATIRGEDLPPVVGIGLVGGDDPAGRDPAVGFHPPAVTAQLLDGGEVTFGGDQAGPTFVLFVTPWCEHCLIQLPDAARWIQQERDDTPELVVVVTDADEGGPPASEWVAEVGIDAPVVYDVDGRIATAFGADSFPHWLLAAGDGTVALRHVGRLDGRELDELADTVS